MKNHFYLKITRDGPYMDENNIEIGDLNEYLKHLIESDNLDNNNGESDAIDAETAIEKITKIEGPKKPVYAKTNNHVNYENVLDENKMESCGVIEYHENDYLSPIVSTTMTMGGFMENVTFHEEQLIKKLEPTAEIARIKCNFGDKIHANYLPIVQAELDRQNCKTNRGRKKKEKKATKERKVQGDGTCFNSQITFVFPTNVPGSKAKPKQPKVFRNGEIQIPGVRPDTIKDNIWCIHKIVELFKSCDAFSNVELKCIQPVMKNYKFRVKLDEGEIIDLLRLKKIMIQYKSKIDTVNEIYESGGEIPDDDYVYLQFLKMLEIKYTIKDVKLSVTIFTPIKGNSECTTKLKIFPSGKVNIQGASLEKDTVKIYDMLLHIFEHKYSRNEDEDDLDFYYLIPIPKPIQPISEEFLEYLNTPTNYDLNLTKKESDDVIAFLSDK